MHKRKPAGFTSSKTRNRFQPDRAGGNQPTSLLWLCTNDSLEKEWHNSLHCVVCANGLRHWVLKTMPLPSFSATKQDTPGPGSHLVEANDVSMYFIVPLKRSPETSLLRPLQASTLFISQRTGTRLIRRHNTMLVYWGGTFTCCCYLLKVDSLHPLKVCARLGTLDDQPRKASTKMPSSKNNRIDAALQGNPLYHGCRLIIAGN